MSCSCEQFLGRLELSEPLMLPPYIYKYKNNLIHHVLSVRLSETQIVIDTNVIQQKEGRPLRT